MKVQELGKLLVATVVVVMLTTKITSAQTLAEAQTKYNEVVQVANTDPATAIKGFEELLTLCKTIEGGCGEIEPKIAESMPVLHYKVAVGYYEQKNVEAAITAFEKTLKVCEQYNNTDLAAKSKKSLPALYNSLAGQKMKDKDFVSAEEALKKALVVQPNYAKAMYSMGLLYKQKGDAANSESWFLKTIENAGDDAKVAESAKKALFSLFIADGKEKATKKDFNGSLKSLEKAAKYTTDADGEAQISYLKGNAYKGLNNKTAACDAYKASLQKAPTSKYAESCKYAVEHELKCQ